ncbi:S1C family serine protease [Anaerocolumna xylanovorans]|uniref:Serine protease Do n=1 Tax=Anaerocolumna xylanovorans DSM 12503 TaxID=1121345 RepID=A0A1M7YHN0_9FIRM|nr:trypsin-like peptidase domain-containing protein [Anaerocolumna xylanovorans]SHO52147.1 serine protease Do [Anaerocolumna xylanovorans DSM 12503]
MSDEFFEEDKTEEAADGNSREAEEINETPVNSNIEEQTGESGTAAYDAAEYNAAAYDGAARSADIYSTEAEGSIYRLSKPAEGENGNEPGSSYSFWAEQVQNTGAGQTYENYQQFKENSGFTAQNGAYYQGTQGGNPEGQNKKKDGFFKKAGKFVAAAVAFGLIAGLAFTGFNEAYYKVNPNAAPIYFNIGGDGDFLINSNGQSKLLSSTAITDGKIAPKTDVTDVIDRTMPSIVQITTTYNQVYNDWFGQEYNEESQGGGSGIIVGKNEKELLIATNNHVVEGADPIKVKFIDGTEAEAIIKGTDSVADIAVISIDLTKIKSSTMDKISIAKLGDSNSIKVGEMAIAIGNALGYGQSTTVGYISAKDREVQVDDKKMVLLQTDAAINPGNSGGALLNLKGEVIGINTVKYSSSEVEGMGFAIPISRATPIIDELMSREILTENEKGYLGVYPQDVTEDVAKMYNWPVGVFVKEIISGGSADKAGIVAGDIITKINDTEITASTQLKEKVNSYRAGTKITVTLMRNVNGKFTEKTIAVTLTSNPQTNTR